MEGGQFGPPSSVMDMMGTHNSCYIFTYCVLFHPIFGGMVCFDIRARYLFEASKSVERLRSYGRG